MHLGGAVKYVFAPFLVLTALASGQTWTVEQVDSAAADGRPVEVVRTSDDKLWTCYETRNGILRAASLGVSGWDKTDVRPAHMSTGDWRSFLAAGSHGELCLSCGTADSGWLCRLNGDSWQSEPYPFAGKYRGGPVAYDTAGRLYTAFYPDVGDFWIGHETDSGWNAGLATSLYVIDDYLYLVDAACMAVAADGSPWYSAYQWWQWYMYFVWGEESALMHFNGDTWTEVSHGSAIPIALVPHGDSIGSVSVASDGSVLMCDSDIVATGVGYPRAGLAYTSDDVPLVAWVPTQSAAYARFAFSTNRWHVESIPGPAGIGGIDIEVDTSGQVVILYSTQDSGLWCARGRDVVGVGDTPELQVLGRKLASTVVRGLPQGAVAFDAMGRRVVNPRSGVYFVRNEGRGVGDVSRTRKVVVQR